MNLTSKGYLKSPDATLRLKAADVLKLHQEACRSTPCYSVTDTKIPVCPYCPHHKKKL